VFVRSHPVDAHRRSAIGETKPEDLIASRAGRSGRFYRNPDMDRENAAPRHGRDCKHLDHRFLRPGGIGREAGWIASRLVPWNAASRVGQAEADQHGDKVQSKQQERGTARDRHLFGTVGSYAAYPGRAGLPSKADAIPSRDAQPGTGS
jgi:hypothetical protein